MKIAILGMGGIGSFIGAKLTQGYENDAQTRVVFICRNKTKEIIQRDGLSLITENGTILSKPDLVSDNAKDIGMIDVLIVATKAFSLADAIKDYRACLKKDTVIILLQNGVNAKSILENNVDHDSSYILEGCIYVTSNMESPGVVKHLGGPGKICFGNDDGLDFKWVEDLLVKGGLDANYSTEIKTILWRKYLFVSPLAAMTTALGIPFGNITASKERMETLKGMMKEVQLSAGKFNVSLTDKDIEDALGMLSNFPYASKSSLQIDFENQAGITEKDSLVDFLITNAKKFGIKVEHYEAMNDKIIAIAARAL